MTIELTAEITRELLDYNSESGEFRWRPRDLRWFSCEGNCRNWNKNFSGNTAGSKTASGYIRINIGGKRYFAHRLAWLHATGEWPEEYMDHINGDRANNALSNLRPVTLTENNRNRRIRCSNTSGYQGVSKSRNRWKAVVSIEGKNIWLGRFDTPEAAFEAYALAATAAGYSDRHIHGGHA